MSANSYGVFIQVAAQGNIVRDNQIGIDVNGLQDRGNRTDGILVGFGATGNIIGGPTRLTATSSLAMTARRADFSERRSVANKVMGNYIGLTARRRCAPAQWRRGVTLWDANNNTVGGSRPWTEQPDCFQRWQRCESIY